MSCAVLFFILEFYYIAEVVPKKSSNNGQATKSLKTLSYHQTRHTNTMMENKLAEQQTPVSTIVTTQQMIVLVSRSSFSEVSRALTLNNVSVVRSLTGDQISATTPRSATKNL